MKRIACLVAVLLLLCGCEYDVPLTQDAVLPVDPALIGLWQEIPEEGKAEDPEERLLILQFSKTEYLVVMSPGEEGGLYFRAYPVRVEDLDLIQLEWLGADKEDEDPYHVCRYLLKEGVLTVEMLNEDVVDSDVEDSVLLQKAVIANREKADLFGKPGRYRKLDQ